MGEDIAIIIPCRSIDEYAISCIQRCNMLLCDNFTIYALPDSPSDEIFANTIIIPTGAIRPSEKRNIAARLTTADYLAFIDSDAYPQPGWLSCVHELFSDNSIGIIGGPNISPPDDGLLKKASDDILSSIICSGPFYYRHKRSTKRFVKELPACNLIIKRRIFEEINGFDVSLLTGEDSKLCFEASKLGYKVLYSPDVCVFHHRRSIFKPLMRQYHIYGRDKFRVLSESAHPDRFLYYLPLLLLATLLFEAILFMTSGTSTAAQILSIPISFYFILILMNSIIKSGLRFPLVFLGTFLVHISYGLGLFHGVLSSLIKKRRAGS